MKAYIVYDGEVDSTVNSVYINKENALKAKKLFKASSIEEVEFSDDLLDTVAYSEQYELTFRRTKSGKFITVKMSHDRITKFYKDFVKYFDSEQKEKFYSSTQKGIMYMGIRTAPNDIVYFNVDTFNTELNELELTDMFYQFLENGS